jgi:putative flippase GtrA
MHFLRSFFLGMPKHRDLRRQVFWYTFVGVLQLIVEWLFFVALTTLGVPLALANVVARTLAALLGFSVNGTITFKSKLNAVLLVRFLITWIPLTLVDTLAVSALGLIGGLGLAWLVKPVVDGPIAVLSFLVARHWVFRTRHQSPAGPNNGRSVPRIGDRDESTDLQSSH